MSEEQCLQCFDAVGWRQEGHLACKNGDGGGRHWLVLMEWHPAGWSVCLPLLIFPCTIKSRSSLLALAHLGGPKRGCKMVIVVVVLVVVVVVVSKEQCQLH